MLLAGAGEAANGSAANGTLKAAEARLPPCPDPITRLKELVRGLRHLLAPPVKALSKGVPPAGACSVVTSGLGL